jgi:HSP20 family protein
MTALIPFIRRRSFSNWPTTDLAFDFDNLFESFNPESRALIVPADIQENDENIIMSFDMPGLKEEEIKISVEGDVLTVSGERKREQKTELKDGSYAYYGRKFGKFHRAYQLPETVDKTKIDADYRDGVLHLLLPKMEPKKENVIDVKVKSKNSVFDKLLGIN